MSINKPSAARVGFSILIVVSLAAGLFGAQFLTERDRKELTALNQIKPDAAAVELKLVQQFPKSPVQDESALWLPVSLVLDRDFNTYISDWNANAIIKFDPQGEFIGRFGKPGQGPGDLSKPGKLFIRDGQLIVVDAGNRRLQYFRFSGESIKTRRLSKFYFDIAFLGDDRLVGAPQFIGPMREKYLLEIVNADGTIEKSFGVPKDHRYDQYIMNERDVFVTTDNKIIVIFKKLAIGRIYDREGHLLKERKPETPFSLLKEKLNLNSNSYLPSERVSYTQLFWRTALDGVTLYGLDYVGSRIWIWAMNLDFQILKTYWAEVGKAFAPRDFCVVHRNGRLRFYILGSFNHEEEMVSIFAN